VEQPLVVDSEEETEFEIKARLDLRRHEIQRAIEKRRQPKKQNNSQQEQNE
jgi:hypothetical protein